MAGSIIIPLITGFDDSGVKKAVGALDSVKNKLGDLRKSAVAGIGSALVGAGAVSFIKEATMSAAELQQAMSGVKTIFGSSTAAMESFIKTSESMGMSNAQAAKAVAFLGSVFKATGMPMQEVMAHTKTMTALASDLAATYGYSVEEALTAMTATFRGEYDPIEKFGVAMKQQQVNALLAAQGLDKLKGNALIAAQQEARYQMILERTTDAQGAFGRQSGNLAVQLSVLNAVYTDMKAKVGQALIPAMGKLVTIVQPLVEKIAPHLGQVFSDIGDSIVTLMPLVPKLVETLMALSDIVRSLSHFFFSVLKPLVDFLAQNSGIVVAFVTSWLMFGKIIPVIKNIVTVTKEWYAVQKALFLMEQTQYVTTTERLFMEMRAGIDGVTTSTKKLTVAQTVLNSTMGKNPLTRIVLPLSVLIAGLSAAWDVSAQHEAQFNKQVVKHTKDLIGEYRLLAGHIDRVKESMLQLPNEQDYYIAGARGLVGYERAYKDAMERIKKMRDEVWVVDYNNLPDNQGRGRSAEQRFGMSWADYQDSKNGKNTDKVKTWFQSLQDDVAKQAAKLKLQKLNLPSGLVDSVLAANDWKTASAKLLNMTQSSLRKVVLAWANTVDGDKASIAGLTARIEYAKQIYKQVTDSVMSYANIAASSGEQVTESYKRMIDGVEVTISKTVDAVSGQNIVKHYEDVVAKTKKFYADLQALKASGLNQALFGQIVQAGVDAGSATAEGILSGGQSSVDALNSLFGELQKTSQDLGDISASVMEDTGNNVMSKFIDGLSSQDTALKAKAKYLATVFSKAFKDGVGVDLSDVVGSVADNKGGKGGKATNQYVINVTAGMGTDGAEVGRKIVQAIKAYERNNGSIWMPAW